MIKELKELKEGQKELISKIDTICEQTANLIEIKSLERKIG